VSFVVLNTDVASASLRGRLPDHMKARLTGQSLCITFVTLGELTKWTHIRSWGPRRLADLRDWRRHVVLLPFDEAVALVGVSCRHGRSIVVGRGW
jgi:toxin FitB